MPQRELIYIVTWAFAVSLLTVFFILALVIFAKTRRKLFGLYALYCFLVLVYCSTKLTYTPVQLLVLSEPYASLNWLIQIGFYSVYYLFGMEFLEIKKNYPKLFRVFQWYVVLLLVAGSGIALYDIIAGKRLLFWFYPNVFIPVHLFVALTILCLAIKKRNRYTYYFIVGSIIYIFFALLAFMGYKVSWLDRFSVHNLSWFYIAIAIESSIFSYALGLMIWNIYKQQAHTSKELNKAMRIIEQQIIDEKKLRGQERILLESQVKEEQLTAKVAFLQNKVLLEQINAHFIFNVLNAIKVFVAEQQSEKAIVFLNKFARFIRSVMDGSRSNLIPLAQELKNMETYLSIEKMRFDDKFQYQFNIEENLALQQTVIPTFLLQPFIENALWHGIMKASRPGFLWINARRVPQGNIIIEIEDNGLGIEHTKAQKKVKTHESVGIRLVDEIIRNYNHTQNLRIDFVIEDMKLYQNGQGTKVTITIAPPGAVSAGNSNSLETIKDYTRLAKEKDYEQGKD